MSRRYHGQQTPSPPCQLFPLEREWRQVIEIITAGIIFAFPKSKADIVSYFTHVFDMANLFASHGDWSHIVYYDARLRIVFATRPALTFADFKNNKLVHIRSMATTAGLSRQPPVYQQHTQSANTYANPHQHHVQHPSSHNAPSVSATEASSASSRCRPNPPSAPRAIWQGCIKQSEFLPLHTRTHIYMLCTR